MKSEILYLTFSYLAMLVYFKLVNSTQPFEYIMGYGVIGGWIYLLVSSFTDWEE